MRVLFSCRPMFGHYAPLVPLAAALERAGHAVSFATGAPLDGTIRRDGFDVDAAGLSASEIVAMRTGDPRFAPAVTNRRLGRPLNFSISFAGFEVPPRMAGLTEAVERRRPDVVVHEAAEFAAPLVAALYGLPAVNHSFGPLVEPEVMAGAGTAAAAHWIESGLAPPERGGMYDRLYLDIAPPSLQFPEIATIPAVQPLRPEPYESPNAQPSARRFGSGRRPLVAVTLGTVWGRDTELCRTILDGLAGEDLDVVVATGDAALTASLSPHPPNAEVHDWVPWGDLLRQAEVAVIHGGAGSTLACLALGVPLVVIPLGADHFTNARLLAASGAAVVLERVGLTPSALRDAVASASGDAARAAAARLAEEIRAMPSPDAVAELVVSLA